MESLPPAPKSVTLLLNLLNQEPVPNEINIAILHVPDDGDVADYLTKNDNDRSTDGQNSGRYSGGSQWKVNKRDYGQCDHCPEKSYAKIATHLGIHAPHLPMLARDFRTEYFSLRCILRNCVDSDKIANIPEWLFLRKLDATTCLLLVCPDHSTAWADRRRVLLGGGDSIDEVTLGREFDFLNLLFTQHSKA